MSFLKSYEEFHRWGVSLLPYEAHIGISFFFMTLISLLGLKILIISFILMMGIITIKEYLDDKTSKKPYSIVDWSMWLLGGFIALGIYLIR